MSRSPLTLVLFVLSLGFTALSGRAQVPNQPRPLLVTEKIKDNLYLVIGNGGNVAFLVTTEGVILIDDKYDADHNAILAEVKKVTDQPVKYVFNTHYHSDHSGGNAKMLPTAEIISHKNSRTNIVEGKQGNAEPGMKPARVVFSEETSVFLGGQEVRARYFGRGHTNGDIVIYFPALKVIHTGDLMAGVTPLIDYSGGGSVVEITKTLDAAMGAFDFDTVIPGHGKVSDRAGLKTYRDNIEKMRAAIAGPIHSGKSQEEVRLILAGLYPDAYGKPTSLQNQWALPGFMTELK
jgi:glyoxylase-like metal-dependent hydrolase (beta-lactamase superfamily II)